MDSDYIKILEDANEKLHEKLVSNQSLVDEYKNYVDIIQKGEVIDFSRYSSDGWSPSFPDDVFQKIHLVIKIKDIEKFPVLDDMVHSYLEQRKKMYDLQQENEIKWERRKQIATIVFICLVCCLAVWGIGWLVWWAYFVTV